MDKVIFRKFPDGDIIALFPEIPVTMSRGETMSYQHLGQHGSVDYNTVISSTKSAKPAEYADLFEELTKIGYELRVYYKRTPQMRDTFNKEYDKMTGMTRIQRLAESTKLSDFATQGKPIHLTNMENFVDIRDADDIVTRSDILMDPESIEFK